MTSKTDTHPRQLWEAALGHLQMEVDKQVYETFLKETTGLAHANGEFVVGASDAFSAEMLEQRMYTLIAQTLESVVGEEVEVRFTVESAYLSDGDAYTNGASNGASERASESPPAMRSRNGGTTAQSRMLNPRYTFDTFVVGKSNELAHAAALAVAGQPGQLYNPLVMYSDVGLGKTHLMHAIGHRLAGRGMSLIYSTTEEFTNSYIKAIRDGTTDEFRDRFRNEDVLLLDDIQFLIGKEQTQEGFFHTFNALHMTNRQIVITSDRPVTALTLLEDRIQSRLAGGLVVDIQPPEIETRVEILRHKAQPYAARGQEISDDAIHFLAERIHRNIRELEGGLNRVLAMADLLGIPATIDLVKRAIADVVETAAERKIPESAVIGAVSTHYGVSVEAIKGRKRDKKTALARQVSMYLLREESQLGQAAIGNALGGKAHNTVMHGCERISNQLNVDAQLRRDLISIRQAISDA